MADIRLKKITVEPSSTLIVQNGDVKITSTTSSTNSLNGALMINGGLGINTTMDATSSTSGGGITLNGQKLYDDAVNELEKLDKQLRDQYELPPLDMIG